MKTKKYTTKLLKDLKSSVLCKSFESVSVRRSVYSVITKMEHRDFALLRLRNIGELK